MYFQRSKWHLFERAGYILSKTIQHRIACWRSSQLQFIGKSPQSWNQLPCSLVRLCMKWATG